MPYEGKISIDLAQFGLSFAWTKLLGKPVDGIFPPFGVVAASRAMAEQ
jgi:hypothetical protein